MSCSGKLNFILYFRVISFFEVIYLFYSLNSNLFYNKPGTYCPGNIFGGATEGTKIINGEEAVPYSWPFAARMKFNGFSGCGGTIVNQNFILTAAHCCAGYEFSPGIFEE